MSDKWWKLSNDILQTKQALNDSFEKWVVENGKCPLIKWKTINKERDKSGKQ